jgi:hypothetical protein
MDQYLTMAYQALTNLGVADEKKTQFRELIKQILEREH